LELEQQQQQQERMSMDVEAELEAAEEEDVEEEVDPMEDSEDDQLEEPEDETERRAKPPKVWPEVSTQRALQYQKEVQAIRETFQDDVDIYDTNMVSEYAEDIFEYMNDLEVRFHPSFVATAV
jgi:molecular chaperone GrpE (heat shock protein)